MLHLDVSVWIGKINCQAISQNKLIEVKIDVRLDVHKRYGYIKMDLT